MSFVVDFKIKLSYSSGCNSRKFLCRGQTCIDNFVGLHGSRRFDSFLVAKTKILSSVLFPVQLLHVISDYLVISRSNFEQFRYSENSGLVCTISFETVSNFLIMITLVHLRLKSAFVNMEILSWTCILFLQYEQFSALSEPRNRDAKTVSVKLSIQTYYLYVSSYNKHVFSCCIFYI